MILSCDSFCFFLKCPKIEEFHFRFLFCFKIDHVFFRNAKLSNLFFVEMPHFSYLILKMRKCTSYHMTKSPFTGFLSYSILLPVFTRSIIPRRVASIVDKTVFLGNYCISTSHVSSQREVSVLCQHEIE